MNFELRSLFLFPISCCQRIFSIYNSSHFRLGFTIVMRSCPCFIACKRRNMMMIMVVYSVTHDIIFLIIREQNISLCPSKTCPPFDENIRRRCACDDNFCRSPLIDEVLFHRTPHQCPASVKGYAHSIFGLAPSSQH